MKTLFRSTRRSAIAVMAIALCIGGWTGVAQAADPKNGATLYNQHCVNCHGQRGVPVMPGVPDFSRRERLMQSDLDLIKAISRGKGMMPAYQGLLSENEILDVISHLRNLR